MSDDGLVRISSIEKMDPEEGEFLMLLDYGSEGLSVGGQYDELEDAVRGSATFNYGNPVALVKIVAIKVSET
jgi:hypothetical protein